jgi:hypothetical protein
MRCKKCEGFGCNDVYGAGPAICVHCHGTGRDQWWKRVLLNWHHWHALRHYRAYVHHADFISRLKKRYEK